MKPQRLGAVALAVFTVGCARGCDPPPSIQSGCWTHEGADEDDVSCASTAEHEPNGDLVAANTLPRGECSLQSVEGRVSDDVDVFRTRGKPCKDRSTPHAALVTPENDVRLCVFAACAHGKTGLGPCSTTSPAGQPPVAAHMPEGAVGCCRVGQGDVSLDVYCDSEYAVFGKSPEWDTYFVVDRVRDTSCTNYKLSYGF